MTGIIVSAIHVAKRRKSPQIARCLGGASDNHVAPLKPHPLYDPLKSMSGRADVMVNNINIGVAMNSVRKWASWLIADDQGGEVMEYALIVGLIVIAAIAAISGVGGQVLAIWNSLNSST
jgi:pilus assembly protein Flp/PilA